MSFDIRVTGHVKHVVDETLPGLIADLAAVILAVWVCRLLFA